MRSNEGARKDSILYGHPLLSICVLNMTTGAIPSSFYCRFPYAYLNNGGLIKAQCIC